MPKMMQTEYGEWYVPYKPGVLRNLMGQSWFPYLCFFIGLAVFGMAAAVTEGIYKRKDLIQTRKHLLQVLPVLGKRTAAVQVIEFTDYACAFCSEDHFKLQKTLQPYIDRGEVALFTLNIQKLGLAGALGTRFEYCISRHDANHLQPFMDRVFQNNNDVLDAKHYQQHYQQTGGTRSKEVQSCLNSPEATTYQTNLKRYVEKLGVQGIRVSYGSVAVQDHVMGDVRGLERWVQDTVTQNGKLPAEFQREAQRLY
ncbi:DsbA family protein [Deinococcus roseus]|uniref:Thioredoxin-like fold domain-containing protein n=1 Tax=Deinococcus roseus TaxID=392414 RepID=A0ABQ2DHG3_9DEIO|nr:thioredoxin domain-containing protein [Deinococcus roseus]GGJ57894.1 hypothetical protein GCM10008938_50010 [Deinococcus roseus]